VGVIDDAPGCVLVGNQEEAGGAAGRVDDCVCRLSVWMTSTIAWISARSEVLARAGALIGGPLGEQLLVGVALDVGPDSDQFSLSIRSTIKRRSLAGS
jgi:hypothetical protein